MRLAFISPCFSDPHSGGVQMSAALAFDALSACMPAALFCYGPNCAGSHEPGAAPGADFVRCRRSKLGAALAMFNARAWPDALLFWHAGLLKLLPFAGARGRLNFLFLHGVECWKPFEGGRARALDRVDMFLSNSDFTWRKFIETNPRWKTAAHRTVALGVGASAPAVAPPDTKPVALMIGRMSREEDYKGHKEVIGVWPEVLRSIPDAELWIAGGGDALDDIRSLAATCDASTRIRFLGVVNDRDKECLLRNSRCLLLPSRGEGFGLVYLESMRLGRPCLCGIHDAGLEVTGAPECGLAADPAAKRDLAAAIVRLLRPGKEWDRWSENARRRYESRFTAADFQRRLLAAVTQGVGT